MTHISIQEGLKAFFSFRIKIQKLLSLLWKIHESDRTTQSEADSFSRHSPQPPMVAMGSDTYVQITWDLATPSTNLSSTGFANAGSPQFNRPITCLPKISADIMFATSRNSCRNHSFLGFQRPRNEVVSHLFPVNPNDIPSNCQLNPITKPAAYPLEQSWYPTNCQVLPIKKYHYESLRIKKQHHVHPCSSIFPHDLPQTARLISTIKTHPLFPMILPFFARLISIVTIFHHQNPSIFPQRHIWSPGYPVLGFPSSSPPAIAARSRSWRRLPCAARSTRCSAPWGGETLLGPWGKWWFSTKWMEMLHQHAPTLFSSTKCRFQQRKLGLKQEHIMGFKPLKPQKWNVQQCALHLRRCHEHMWISPAKMDMESTTNRNLMTKTRWF